jgi:hypothetical protein
MDTIMILMDNEAKNWPSNVRLERAREKKQEQKKNVFQRTAVRLMHWPSIADGWSGIDPDPVSVICLDDAVLNVHVSYSMDEGIQVSFMHEVNQLMSLPPTEMTNQNSDSRSTGQTFTVLMREER